jgi:hypothetical protein
MIQRKKKSWKEKNKKNKHVERNDSEETRTPCRNHQTIIIQFPYLGDTQVRNK